MELKDAKQLLGSKVTVKGHIQRVTYKAPNYQTGDYAVIKFACEEVESGDWPIEFAYPAPPNADNPPVVAFQGPTPSLNLRCTYEIRAELVHSERFGYQYKILCMTEAVSFQTKDDVAKFFAYIFPEISAQRILETLEDPITVLENKDVKTLMRVPMIGPYRAMRLIEKYSEMKMNSKAYVQLFEYGLSQAMIKKLVNSYGSPELLIEKITENPYRLIYDVKGIGWAKADQIALNIGITETDPRRVTAYIYYLFIKDGMDNGNTYMPIDEVLDAVVEQIPDLSRDDIRRALLSLINDDKLFFEKATRRVGLMEYRKVEELIAKHLYRISKASTKSVFLIEDAIRMCEKDVGFTYSEEQRKAIKDCLTQNINIVSGLAGCVDCDTEFFNGTEWKRIADYQEGDKVLCWNEKEETNLFEPFRFIKKPCSKLWYVHNNDVDMCVSDEHNCVYYDIHNNLHVTQFSELQEEIENFDGCFITLTKWGTDILNSKNLKVEEWTPIDGFKYCFSVPTEKWVSRRNGKVVIQGNCGKSSIMYPVTKALELNRQVFEQCALSGKAALNLTEITHCEGKTIHRLLGYSPDTGEFLFNEQNKLPLDMIILDETSMIDESLFLSLLKAIPDGCKLVMLGDTGQLEPIGLGCLFRDLINSDRINHIHFTKIFRQALKSGIISEAAKVYEGIPIMTRGKKAENFEIRGELQDFKVIAIPSNGEPQGDRFIHDIVGEYKRFMDEYSAKPKDIIVVTGKRVAGPTSARNINENIQKLLNRNPAAKSITIDKKDGELKYSITFRVGDRVLVTKNCYTTLDLEGNETPVFNGNIGDIVDIEEMGMKIKFLQGTVYYPLANYPDLELGYAITCHKCVSGDTEIITDKGPMKLIDLDNGAEPYCWKELENAPLVYSGYGWERPTAFYNAGVCKGYRIVTETNHYLECTDDHLLPFFSLEKGVDVTEEVQNIKVGDSVLIPYGDGGVWYDTVVSKEPITLQAYSINMEQTHMFVQNGILGCNCQGSGIPYVITVCDWGSYTLLSKEWLYTAITRAKKFNTLIAQAPAVISACDHTSIVFKRTWLQDLLQDVFDGILPKE